MESTDMIRKLTDYLLLSKYQVDFSGLYNGKMGIALGLFEAARYLHDDTIEDEAFNLLQESLLTKNKDVSFENGWSGIGYTLLYLIEEKFIDADFDEIFKEHSEEIIERFEKIDKQPDFLLSSMKVICFLIKLSMIRKDDQRMNSIVKKIFQGLELYLSIQFFDFKDIRYINNKTNVITIYESYLKLVDYSDYHDYSISLLNAFTNLYRNDRIASSLPVGYYLDRILSRGHIYGYEDIINSNLNSGIKNIKSDVLSLEQQIDFINLVGNIDERRTQTLLLDLGLIKQSMKLQIFDKTERELFKPKYQFCVTCCLIYLTNSKFNLL